MDLRFLHNPELKVVPNFCVQIVGRPKLNYPNQFSGVISKVVCHIPHQEEGPNQIKLIGRLGGQTFII